MTFRSPTRWRKRLLSIVRCRRQNRQNRQTNSFILNYNEKFQTHYTISPANAFILNRRWTIANLFVLKDVRIENERKKNTAVLSIESILKLIKWNLFNETISIELGFGCRHRQHYHGNDKHLWNDAIRCSQIDPFLCTRRMIAWRRWWTFRSANDKMENARKKKKKFSPLPTRAFTCCQLFRILQNVLLNNRVTFQFRVISTTKSLWTPCKWARVLTYSIHTSYIIHTIHKGTIHFQSLRMKVETRKLLLLS